MASRHQVAEKKKTNDETPKKTQSSLSDQEKNYLGQKIKNLESEIKRLSLENVIFKNNFDLRQIINSIARKGVPELDPIEMAQDMVRIALQEADEKLTAEKTELENTKKILAEVKQNVKADIEKTRNEIKEQQFSQEEFKGQVEKGSRKLLAVEQEIIAIRKILEVESKALKQSEEKNKILNEKLKNLEVAKDNLNQQVQALMKENNELKYRLRELTSAHPAFNNPNIDELSDAFRPTKLSERYNQLYDNMWTDAFEEHSGKKEEDIIQFLRKKLLGSYEFCENVCREFTVQLTNSTLALPNSKPHNRLQDIPMGYKKQLQEIKKNFGVFLRNDVKESYRKKHNSIEGGDNTKKYIDACVELCWLMVIQDPPVVIETPASKDSALDTNTYRAYTTTGPKVDFVVWPALRLHHGGPLLTKGVAQGKK